MEREYRKEFPRTKHPMASGVLEKLCKKCQRVLPIISFGKNASSKDGFYYHCKPCGKAVRDQREIDHPGYAVKQYMKYRSKLTKEQIAAIHARAHFKKYGVTQEWFDKKLTQQKGCCAICGTNGNQRTRRFAIDHDHSCCGKNCACDNCRRDILCDKCNFILGVIENIEWSAKALAYLQRHGKDLGELHMVLTVPSEHPTKTPCTLTP